MLSAQSRCNKSSDGKPAQINAQTHTRERILNRVQEGSASVVIAIINWLSRSSNENLLTSELELSLHFIMSCSCNAAWNEMNVNNPLSRSLRGKMRHGSKRRRVPLANLGVMRGRHGTAKSKHHASLCNRQQNNSLRAKLRWSVTCFVYVAYEWIWLFAPCRFEATTLGISIVRWSIRQ